MASELEIEDAPLLHPTPMVRCDSCKQLTAEAKTLEAGGFFTFNTCPNCVKQMFNFLDNMHKTRREKTLD